jgi:hypothetical protein
MRLLTIDGSPTQLRKLRSGKAVRIKKGTGCNVIVSPTTYKLATRAFNKGKGSQITLSPEEIEMNRKASITPEMHQQIAEEMRKETGQLPSIAGQGIFGKKFDKFLAKTGLNKITDPLGEVLKPLAKKGISAVAGMAKNLPVTKFIPGAEKVIGNVEEFATDYLDNPSKYNEGDKKEALGRIRRKITTGQGLRGRGMRGCGSKNPLGMASRAVARANAMNADITGRQISQRISNQYPSYDELKQEPFAPFSRGYGMHSKNQNSIVGMGGGMISHYVPPALVSQPLSANYQMSHFLPPHFQHFNNSMGFSGNGLYL